MKLIDDIKNFHKFLSVRVNVVGSALVAIVIADPNTASAAIGSLLPPKYMPFAALGVSLFVSLCARAVKQKNLDKGKSDGNSST